MAGMEKQELVKELGVFAQFPSMAQDDPSRLQAALIEAIAWLAPPLKRMPGQLEIT